MEKNSDHTHNSRHTSPPSVHWADVYAWKTVHARGKKAEYTCASGVTPSGTVHIGNFREVISVDLVVRALRQMGKKTRFIFSWDDYDVFRKVPKDLEDIRDFESYLRKPIVDVPDPHSEEESYARAHEKRAERSLKELGIYPDYIYQAEEYRRSVYAHGIRKALEYRREIMEILNVYRSEALPFSWYPVSIFSSFTGRDTTTVLSWNGEWKIYYRCNETGKQECIDLRTTRAVKLLWRIDWPMRWKHEEIDFEPAGKDHHSHGGSFDSAKEIAKKVYRIEAPVSFQYDFVGLKGVGGKISSSEGATVSVDDMLQFYQPQVVRYLFASTRPNVEFVISFDLDLLKIYEDYDRCERFYYGQEEGNVKKKEKESRIYEFSQVGAVRKEMPYQISIRHLCNVLQIYAGDVEKTVASFRLTKKEDSDYLRDRCRCAWNWVQTHAPTDFRFSLADVNENAFLVDEGIKRTFYSLSHIVRTQWNALSDKDINDAVYRCARDAGKQPKEVFTALYTRLIRKEKGPRLGSFLKILGKETVLKYLDV